MSKRKAAKGKLILPSQMHEIPRAEEAIMQVVEAHGFSDHDRFAIKLALEEALANAIKHGNRFDPGKQVVVEFHVDGLSIRICVADEGRGFDPRCVADPTLDENLEKPCGRGVMLMRVYMNEVNYNATGNRVTLVRQRTDLGDPIS